MSAVGLRVMRLPEADPALPLPRYATAGAAGMDVAANLPEPAREAGLLLAPGGRLRVPTGLAVAVPEGYEIQARPRSGWALSDGVTLLNSPGTIDSDYRGEIGVVLVNHGTAPVTVAHGMRIAQLVLAPVARAEWEAVGALAPTPRGAGGFGSTGRGGADG